MNDDLEPLTPTEGKAVFQENRRGEAIGTVACTKPMSTTIDRLKRLREANQIVMELGDKFDGDGRERTRSIRSSLETAGRHINYGQSDDHLQDAIGETAGLAIDQGWHELADRAYASWTTKGRDRTVH